MAIQIRAQKTSIFTLLPSMLVAIHPLLPWIGTIKLVCEITSFFLLVVRTGNSVNIDVFYALINDLV